jgi:hypothetical protein
MSGWGKGGRARRSAPHTAAHAHAGGPRVSAAAQVHSPRCPQLPLLLSLIVWGNARRLPELGNQIAPYFAVAQIIFLLMFVAYFTLGVVALIHDHEAMDCECAEDSWIWLYALLVVVIPTSLGTMRAWAGWMRLRMAYLGYTHTHSHTHTHKHYHHRCSNRVHQRGNGSRRLGRKIGVRHEHLHYPAWTCPLSHARCT